MLDYIRGLPHIVEKFVAHLETPAVVDLLYRIIQCEESVPNADVVDWLSNQDLIVRVVELLSPSHSSDLHNTVSELLKAIISLSAPSPANLTQSQSAEAFGFGSSEGFGNSATSVCGVNNRLVRELASEPIVRKMVGFMLDASLPSQLVRRLSQAADEQLASIAFDIGSLPDRSSSKFRKPSAQAIRASKLGSLSENTSDGSGGASEDSALEDEDLEEESIPSRKPLNPRDTPASEQSDSLASPGHRDSTVTIRPHTITPPILAPQVPVSPESCTSTLVTCIGVLIELIRKNNSDYFEQHLFHTLRTHLLQRQQEIAERKTKDKSEKEVEQNDDDDDEMEGMEEAMAELSDKLGIVHLGPMLRILCERLPDFQQLIKRPRVKDDKTSTSLGILPALTFERYRITELYAELLHCSNMALLNRTAGEGPQYNDDGVLQGGIEGLQVLARTLQGGDASSDAGEGTPNEASAIVGDADPTQGVVESDAQVKVAGEAEEPKPRSHSRDATKHTRESSITGGGVGASNGSEDTDDEALLSEVSLKEGATANHPVNEASDPFADAEQDAQTRDAPAEEDDEIRSALSNLSLADLTSPAPSGPPSPMDNTREYVVGDLLKKKFLESDVTGTILTLFFEYPWNNFLHNVVYDILQQFFNGRMDVGLNRRLTLAVFENGGLTEKIVRGHHRNEESLNSDRRIRMGYMGHMNLIAEETVKLLERYPHEIERHVKEHISTQWQEYVNETLKENREKEAAPLAGGRPQMIHPLAFSNQHGGIGADREGGAEGGETDAFASYLTSQMGAGNTSDDDDSDEDASWLSQDIKHSSTGGPRGAGNGDGFDDAFEPSTAGMGARRGGVNDDDDDEWGPFADSTDASQADRGQPEASSSAQAYLTPADWASDFHRSTSAAETGPDQPPTVEASEAGEAGDDSSSATSTASNGEEEGTGRKSSDSADSTSSTPFIDLLDSASLRQSDAVAAAHARRPSLGQYENAVTPNIVGGNEMRRRASGSAGSSDPSAAQASVSDEPLGPGVAPDARSDEGTGMIERTINGELIRVPLDDVALMSGQNTQQQEADDTESALED